MVELKKRTNGAGSVRPYPKDAPPSQQRLIGTVTRSGKIVKRVYGAWGKLTKADELVMWTALKPYLDLPVTSDGTATVQMYMDDFAKRATAPSTRDRYKRAISYLPTFGAKRMIDVKPSDIEDALAGIQGEAERGATMNRTRQIAYDVLSGAFKRAEKKTRILSFNPMDAVEKPKYRRETEPVVFTPEEQRFMHAEAGRHKAMLMLGLSMPLRLCELFGLQRRDVSIARREAQVRRDLIETKENGYKPTLGPEKTDESRRDLPLDNEVAAALTKHLAGQLEAGRSTPESFLFTAPEGGPIRHTQLTARWWRPLLERAAVEAEKAARKRGETDYRFPVEARFNDLRHTAMENLKAAGVPLDVFHVLCGHRSIATSLKHYNRPSPKRRHEAAAAVSSWLAAEGGRAR